MPVEFATAKRATMAEQILVVGNLIGAATIEVVPRANGRLQVVDVKLGDPVRKGQIIARVEDFEVREQVRGAEAAYAVAQASIRQRQADLKLAQNNLDRSRSLYERQLLPQQTFDDVDARHQAAVAQLQLAEAQFEASKARLEELKIALTNTQIVAPVDGFVGKRYLDPGAFASTNAPVASVVDIRTVRMVANLVERDMRRVPVGTAANVEVDAYPGETFKGRVSRVAPVFDPATRTAEIEIEVPNDGYRLKPGMYSRVQLTISTRGDAITVPRNALVDLSGRTGVFVAAAAEKAEGTRGGGGPDALTARFIPVEVGIRDGEAIEITQGPRRRRTHHHDRRQRAQGRRSDRRRERRRRPGTRRTGGCRRRQRRRRTEPVARISREPGSGLRPGPRARPGPFDSLRPGPFDGLRPGNAASGEQPMSIPRLAIERPVTMFMLSAVIMLIGGLSLVRLPVDLMPDVSFPSITVRVGYAGVGPLEMEELVTRPLEQALSAVAGLERLKSTSSEGSARVTLNFAWGTDLNEAADDIRTRLDRVRGRLPEEADAPIMFKFDASAAPIMGVGLEGDYDRVRLREIAEHDLSQRLERVPGVAAVTTEGGLRRQIHVELSKEKIRALDLSVDRVVNLLRTENQNIPARRSRRGRPDVPASAARASSRTSTKSATSS